MQRARWLAVVPQARSLPAAFTVYDTVLLGRTPYLGWLGQASAADHTKTRLAIERTQTGELAQRRVGELSGGEQQRVLLARALAQETPVLLLDEPTTHLDLRHQSSLLNLVRELAAQQDLAVLMVLHDLNLASIYADRVALLVNGRLEALGSPHSVLTERNLAEVYRVPVHVIPHPEYGNPLILPDGRIGQ
jgi:iron complex transport system ATP-binding protein